MKMFITGASGFVGGAIAKYFASQGHDIYAMSRSEITDESIRMLGAKPVRCSLSDVSSKDLNNCNIVIHAAAHVEAYGNSEVFETVNVNGTKNILKAAKDSGVTKFIHISTESVLWHGQDIIDADEKYPYTSSTPFLYSKTKRDAEQLVLKENLSGSFETIVLRPRLIWGPGDKTILPRAMKMHEEGKFKWIDNGNFNTSTTHIDNLVHAISLSIVNAKGGEVYFITDDEIITIKNFFTSLFASQEIKLKVGSLPKAFVRSIAFMIEKVWKLLGIKKQPPVSYQAACFMSAHCTLNIEKAKTQLNYKPIVLIDEGMRQLHQLYIQNKL